MIRDVVISRLAKRQLRRIPTRIVNALDAWIDLIETEGLQEARKIPGYHDEPLKGDRLGQRSIRLNIAYRAIYEIKSTKKDEAVIEFASIEKVSKHDY